MDIQDQLAYDLRLKYAEITGIHLERCALARMSKNYPEYFNSLEDLFTIVRHKFKKTYDETDELYETDKKKKKEKPLDIYNRLRDKAIKVCNKHPQIYLGKNMSTGEAVAEVEGALRAVEMFLYEIMDKAKMFGSGGYVEGM